MNVEIRVPGSILSLEIYMFYPCLLGFPLGSLVSSNFPHKNKPVGGLATTTPV